MGIGADEQLPELVGRGDELALVQRFVEQSARDGGALMVWGEAGVGKTALLEAAAAHGRAVGMRVLRATGAQFEATVSFAGLHQALYPLLESVAELPPPWKVALEAAFGLVQTPPSDRLVVSSAVLELLRHSARTNPVLVVVDDLPWLDPVSANALGFVARRAAGTRVGVLAATPTGEPQPFEHAGIPTHDLRPLSAQAAATLLARRYPALSPRVSQRLLAEARGNPLALLELPVALLQHSGPAPGPLPDTLPLTHRLQSTFASRIGALAADCRAALLLAVLDAAGDLGVLTADEAAALEAADRMRLVTLDHAAARITFRHPLIRTAVVELSTGDERRHAHHVLAARRVDDPARHAWHLAEASTRPDEHVAALLQQVAHTNLFRGDALGAITELLRAAELSPQGTDRSTRLAEAAYLGATVTGDLSTVPALMDAARRADHLHNAGEPDVYRRSTHQTAGRRSPTTSEPAVHRAVDNAAPASHPGPACRTLCHFGCKHSFLKERGRSTSCSSW